MSNAERLIIWPIGIAYHDDYQVVAVSCHLADPVPGGQLIVTWECA